jgi:hypothetical protein
MSNGFVHLQRISFNEKQRKIQKSAIVINTIQIQRVSVQGFTRLSITNKTIDWLNAFTSADYAFFIILIRD